MRIAMKPQKYKLLLRTFKQYNRIYHLSAQIYNN